MQSQRSMDLQPESADRPVAESLKATYRALLARGLEPGEAANLTAFLHGLPSAGLRWTLPEIDAIIQRRLVHAADSRAAALAANSAITGPRPRSTSSARRASTIRRTSPARPKTASHRSRSGPTHVIDPPIT
jgi:hypothetical protein